MSGGRPAKPVPATAGPQLRALACGLREFKDACGLTYTELSERTGEGTLMFAPSTLRRAASGTSLPRREVVDAFARVAGTAAGARRRARRAAALWLAADAERHLRGAPPVPRPRIRQVRSPAALVQALDRMHAAAGRPSLDATVRLAAVRGHRLSRSTLHRILTGALFPTHRQFTALLEAWEVADADAWRHARGRIEDRRPVGAASVPAAWYGCADADPRLQDALARAEFDEELRQRITGRSAALDWYDEQLERERTRERDELIAYYEGLSEEELEQVEDEVQDGAARLQGLALVDVLARMRNA